jgi:hypothetical protein
MDMLLSSYQDRILIFISHDPYVTERVDEVVELWPGAEVLEKAVQQS